MFKGIAYNGRIEYNRYNHKLYLTHSHNDICNNNKPQIDDNIGEIKSNVYEFSDFKNHLINYLNKHPLITQKSFKEKVNFFLKGNFDLLLKKNTFANIYYPWRNNSKLFSWFNIFDNIYINYNKIYLKDVSF